MQSSKILAARQLTVIGSGQKLHYFYNCDIIVH